MNCCSATTSSCISTATCTGRTTRRTSTARGSSPSPPRLRDDKGKRIGLMCVNMDVSQFDQAIKLLSAFAAPSEPRPEAMFRQDWREHINLVIRAFLETKRKALKALDREERIALIAEIDAAGLFAARNAAPHVASAMNVSRATVYALLNAARNSSMKAAQ